MIAPDGLEAHKGCLEPRESRTFRFHECLGAGDGRIVASIRPIPMREVGSAKLSDELHTAIPPGSAAALADALVEGLCLLEVEKRHQLACLELRESHGVPYLVLRFRRWWNGSARIVPGDWLGMAPAVFAAKVAERLGVPLRNRIRA